MQKVFNSSSKTLLSSPSKDSYGKTKPLVKVVDDTSVLTQHQNIVSNNNVNNVSTLNYAIKGFSDSFRDNGHLVNGHIGWPPHAIEHPGITHLTQLPIANVKEGHQYSDVVYGLTGSQGSLSLITALLSGFAFAGLTNTTMEEYKNAPNWVAVLYPIATTLTIALSFYTSICCAVLEQHGRIAKALAVARGPNTVARQNFEKELEEWYSESGFRTWRTGMVWIFMYGTIGYGFSIGLLCLIKMPFFPGCVGILATLLCLNGPFRTKVLRLNDNHKYSAPQISGFFNHEGSTNLEDSDGVLSPNIIQTLEKTPLMV